MPTLYLSFAMLPLQCIGLLSVDNTSFIERWPVNLLKNLIHIAMDSCLLTMIPSKSDDMLLFYDALFTERHLINR